MRDLRVALVRMDRMVLAAVADYAAEAMEALQAQVRADDALLLELEGMGAQDSDCPMCGRGVHSSDCPLGRRCDEARARQESER
jgi:hypothetical protein